MADRKSSLASPCGSTEILEEARDEEDEDYADV
jgi:hypothetical protein